MNVIPFVEQDVYPLAACAVKHESAKVDAATRMGMAAYLKYSDWFCRNTSAGLARRGSSMKTAHPKTVRKRYSLYECTGGKNCGK